MIESGVTLGQVAQHIGADLHGDPSVRITGLATLEEASPDQLAFLANPAYARFLEQTTAAAVIVHPKQLPLCPVAALVLNNPYKGYALASQLFATLAEGPVSSAPRVHPSAVIDPSARIAADVQVGAHAVIEAGVVVAPGCVIGPNCFLGRSVQLGEASRLYPHVTLYHGVRIGARAILHSGAVIGADGFGFAPDAAGYVKIAQLGGVVIGDDVEIGANTTIDRGALGDTRIGHGVKLDNQIQIAHNVQVGDHTVIAACTGISGSSRVGARCMIGGGVGIAGHLTIADGVHLTGMTLVTHDLREAGVYSSGTAVEDNRTWRRNVARFRQLDQWIRRLLELERKMK